MKFADLHLHTVFSDGTYTPEELSRAASKAGLSVISVVDHDTVLGLGVAKEACLREGIELVPGIELTAEFEGLEIHILGYFIDYENPLLLERLGFLKKNRIERIHRITDKLKTLGKNLEPQDVFALAEKGTVGRLHVAQAMMKKGLVKSTWEAFQLYIGDKCPAYVLGFRFSPQETIELIRKVGGIPVLAHPYSLGKDDLITKFVDCGLMGLEVYYTEHSAAMTKKYLEIARKYNLLITGGSDCHGLAKPEVKIGSIKIPYSLVESLKAASTKLGIGI